LIEEHAKLQEDLGVFQGENRLLREDIKDMERVRDERAEIFEKLKDEATSALKRANAAEEETRKWKEDFMRLKGSIDHFERASEELLMENSELKEEIARKIEEVKVQSGEINQLRTDCREYFEKMTQFSNIRNQNITLHNEIEKLRVQVKVIPVTSVTYCM
jgi:SMC interacting uncharacterized protein involved in chromosome segregation